MTEGGANAAPGANAGTQAASAAGSAPSGVVENKVKVIGNYVLTFKTLGKGNFARVEEAQHTATKAKVRRGATSNNILL